MSFGVYNLLKKLIYIKSLYFYYKKQGWALFIDLGASNFHLKPALGTEFSHL